MTKTPRRFRSSGVNGTYTLLDGSTRIAAAGLAAICFGSFVRAMARHFQATRPLARMTRITAVGGAATAAVHLGGLVALPLWRPWLAVALYAAAIALFHRAIAATQDCAPRACFDAGSPRALATAGPYRYIRHPFYTAYMTAWAAGFAGTGWWPLLVSGLAMSAIYLRAARLEERELAGGIHGAAYRVYMRRTGRFLPWKIASHAGAIH
ncbi:MAG: isoprenylcysteine carboxylmethyltransferase family protein [Bryobacteraceae bacterium]